MFARLLPLLAVALLFTQSSFADKRAPYPTPDGKGVTLPTADESWEENSDEDDDVQVFSKDVEGKDIVAFMGITVLDAPIAKVATVLDDTSKKTEWVHNAEEAKDLRTISPTERIEYNHTDTPIGFSDRDFVFHVKVDLDRAKKQMVILMKSVEDKLMPEHETYVRGKINEGRYILTSVDGGKKTHILVEFDCDPMGAIPKWLVNIFQKAWPENTLEGISDQLKKPYVTEHPRVKAFFEGKDSMLSAVQKTAGE